jgi:hypothetical protein
VYIQQPSFGTTTVTNYIHVKDGNPAPLATATVSGPAPQPQLAYAEAVANPVVTNTRSMYVVVPSNAGPGSVLTIVAPNGATLSVSFLLAIYPTFILIFDSFRLFAPRMPSQEARFL